MFERLLLAAVIAGTSVTAVACDTSEAAPQPPAPARRDAGMTDAAPSTDARIDARAIDARTIDARTIDAAAIDARAIDAATIDATPTDALDLLRDSDEAPPLYDARLL